MQEPRRPAVVRGEGEGDEAVPAGGVRDRHPGEVGPLGHNQFGHLPRAVVELERPEGVAGHGGEGEHRVLSAGRSFLAFGPDRDGDPVVGPVGWFEARRGTPERLEPPPIRELVVRLHPGRSEVVHHP